MNSRRPVLLRQILQNSGTFQVHQYNNPFKYRYLIECILAGFKSRLHERIGYGCRIYCIICIWTLLLRQMAESMADSWMIRDWGCLQTDQHDERWLSSNTMMKPSKRLRRPMVKCLMIGTCCIADGKYQRSSIGPNSWICSEWLEVQTAPGQENDERQIRMA